MLLKQEHQQLAAGHTSLPFHSHFLHRLSSPKCIVRLSASHPTIRHTSCLNQSLTPSARIRSLKFAVTFSPIDVSGGVKAARKSDRVWSPKTAVRRVCWRRVWAWFERVMVVGVEDSVLGSPGSSVEFVIAWGWELRVSVSDSACSSRYMRQGA